MITESMAIQRLYAVLLSTTTNQKWRAATGSFGTNTSSEGLFTAFAVGALLAAVVLLFWVFAKYKRTEHTLNLKVAELTVNNIKLQQQNKELKDANETVRKENAELYRKKVEALENIITSGEARSSAK
ncbi:MAG: hypothetical protein JW837_01575 [Sedimentisphaerales bacterium]|nr:hypothetical protein [Sedimentisphaerales bacterium]